MVAALLAVAAPPAAAVPAPANVYVVATVSGGVPSPATPLSAGDCALVIQMTGTIADGLGVHEILDPATSTPTRTYSNTEAVQYVVLPGGCSQTIEVTSTYTPPEWTQLTGTGGVVFLGGSTLTLNADIDASAAGFASGHTVGAGCDGGDGEAYNGTMWEGGGGGGGVIGGGGGAAGHIGDTDFGTEATFDGSPGGGGTGTTAGVGGVNGDAYGVSPSGGDAGCVGNGGSQDRDTIAGGFWTTGAGAGGGGSYGGGGAGCSSLSSAAYSGGGGGGGSLTGGGAGGVGGTNTGYVNPEENGFAGNVASTTLLGDADHYFNDTDPRVMMGGAGGASFSGDGSGPYPGGRGGGIVILAFDSVVGAGGSILGNGGDGSTPPNFSNDGSHGSSGSGGGAGGQVVIYAPAVSNTLVTAEGGIGGDAVEDTSNSQYPHTGSAGASGGGGGIWFAGVGTDSSNSGPNVGETASSSTLAATGLVNVDWIVSGGTDALSVYPSGVTLGSQAYTGDAWAALVGAANVDSQATNKWIVQSLVDASGGAFTLADVVARFPSMAAPNNPKNLGLGCTPGLGGNGFVATSALSNPPVGVPPVTTTTTTTTAPTTTTTEAPTTTVAPTTSIPTTTTVAPATTAPTATTEAPTTTAPAVTTVPVAPTTAPATTEQPPTTLAPVTTPTTAPPTTELGSTTTAVAPPTTETLEPTSTTVAPTSETTAPPIVDDGRLAFTGSSSASLFVTALALVLLGSVVLASSAVVGDGKRTKKTPS